MQRPQGRRVLVVKRPPEHAPHELTSTTSPGPATPIRISAETTLGVRAELELGSCEPRVGKFGGAVGLVDALDEASWKRPAARTRRPSEHDGEPLDVRTDVRELADVQQQLATDVPQGVRPSPATRVDGRGDVRPSSLAPVQPNDPHPHRDLVYVESVGDEVAREHERLTPEERAELQRLRAKLAAP
jgi:hypothetical protein